MGRKGFEKLHKPATTIFLSMLCADRVSTVMELERIRRRRKRRIVRGECGRVVWLERKEANITERPKLRFTFIKYTFFCIFSCNPPHVPSQFPKIVLCMLASKTHRFLFTLEGVRSRFSLILNILSWSLCLCVCVCVRVRLSVVEYERRCLRCR